MAIVERILCFLIVFLLLATNADADLITIGSATYKGSEYNLIWDDDNNGKSVVWLDYTNQILPWPNQVDWADSLNETGVMTLHINPIYTVDWGMNLWRLPFTRDGDNDRGYDGNSNAGYNISHSEIGHLFYTELQNQGHYDYIDGRALPVENYGLINTGGFEQLEESTYWFSTKGIKWVDYAWRFSMKTGYQGASDYRYSNGCYGLSIRTGQVSLSSVPEPSTIFLFSLGILFFAAHKRNLKFS